MVGLEVSGVSNIEANVPDKGGILLVLPTLLTI